MWFYFLLTWIALVIQICFITVSIAAGLYYLAELVEEYTVIAKKCISYMVIITTFCFFGFWLFEDLPLNLTICGAVAQIAHWIILQTFPFVNPFSPVFIVGVALLLVNHYLAFQYFGTLIHTFSEVMAFFTICLWLVPFALFISLSANEYVLPTTAEKRPLLDESDVVSNYFSQRGKKYGLLSFFNYAKDSILPQRTKKSF